MKYLIFIVILTPMFIFFIREVKIFISLCPKHGLLRLCLHPLKTIDKLMDMGTSDYENSDKYMLYAVLLVIMLGIYVILCILIISYIISII